MSSPQFASPTADAPFASVLPNQDGSGIASALVSRAMANMNVWTVLATTLLALVLYDQC